MISLVLLYVLAVWLIGVVHTRCELTVYNCQNQVQVVVGEK